MKCKHKVAAEVIRADIFEQNIPKCTKCSISENESLQQQNNDQADQAGPSSSSSNLEQQQQPESIMKPDIVFFGEGLGDEFHQSVARDKEDVDLLIMIGSSLKVRPVALIPSSIDPSIPQVMVVPEYILKLIQNIQEKGCYRENSTGTVVVGPIKQLFD
jgi:NAD-dependent deacetylase sirtuin 1